MFFEGDGEGRLGGNLLDDFEIDDVKFEAAGGAAVGADLSVTMTLDSSVRPLMRSKTSGATAALGTMPWIVPVPSRKMGKRSLPLSRRL